MPREVPAVSQAPHNPFFADEGIPSEARTYATFNHVVPLIAHLGGPFLVPLIAAVVMWQIKKDENPFLDDHGRESTNFQLSLLVYAVLIIPLAIITCGLAAWLALPLFILNIIGCVLAARAAHQGNYYRYPMSIRFF